MAGRKWPLAFFLFMCLLSIPLSANACACCAEPGTYDVWTTKIEDYNLELIKNIKFDKSVRLFMTEAGFETIRGLAALEKEEESGTLGDIGIIDAFTKNTWKLNFKTPGGKTGILSLPVPYKMTILRIDAPLRDATPDDEGKGPNAVLYKEFQFRGTVGGGTGIFRGGIIRPTKYKLVFQGYGNNCDNAEDFTQWHLDVTGSKARYAFFGKLNS